MKAIGDCLGHRAPASTAVYARVDLARLRQVADLDLEGLAWRCQQRSSNTSTGSGRRARVS